MTGCTHRITCLAALLAIATGCTHEPAGPPLPSYPLVAADMTVAQMGARSTTVANLTGHGAVTLTSPTRGAVELESVYVLRPPGDARVRAWKFNQAVFDLTVLKDGVWLYSPRDRSNPSEISAAGRSLGDSVRQWIGLLMGDLQSPGTTMRLDGDRLLLTRVGNNGGTLAITIDRPTQTVRAQRLMDDRGTERFRLTFDDYRLFNGTPWPTRITAISPTGTIIVRTDTLTLNDAPDTAFKPSPRATKLP